MKINVLIISFIILISNVYSQDQNAINDLSVGDSIFDFIGKNDKGKEIQLSEFKGKYVLLNFTATYCGPCWNTYNQMNELQAEYQEKLVVISFHLDDQIELWNSIAQKKKITFDCLSIWTCDNKKNIIDTYGVNGYPYFVLINDKGIIVKKWFGHKESKLNNLIKKKLK
ncbi:MAG: peroxiredoxin [Vicingaceae bacterium]|jgi:peroxiredoxin